MGKIFLTGVLLVSMIQLYASTALAHGVVGDYVFLEPLIAEDPTPANELDIVEPVWNRTSDGTTYSIGSGIEKVLGFDREGQPRFSVGAETSWSYNSAHKGPSANGFDNPEMFVKFAPLIIPEHEFLVSVLVQAEISLGDPRVTDQKHSSLGPTLLWEKGMGDLPNSGFLKYLRPFGFQADFGYLPALGGHTSHLLFGDQVIEYSLPYLSNSVMDIGLKPPLRNLFVFTEINYNQLIAGPPGETFPNIVATPGVAYVGYNFEFSVGTQLALNQAAVSGTHAVMIALLDIFYDSIVPQVGNWRVFGR
jgi:hypothetical protein